ncbi:hypothetical protein F4780DRAFT_659855 [Xylariomycetidae sp. FL0641]|nr:hypothetical protein F4780DRAFT_659855 [Xylariomycetidae sp. FL0641]
MAGRGNETAVLSVRHRTQDLGSTAGNRYSDPGQHEKQEFVLACLHVRVGAIQPPARRTDRMIPVPLHRYLWTQSENRNRATMNRMDQYHGNGPWGRNAARELTVPEAGRQCQRRPGHNLNVLTTTNTSSHFPSRAQMDRGIQIPVHLTIFSFPVHENLGQLAAFDLLRGRVLRCLRVPSPSGVSLFHPASPLTSPPPHHHHIPNLSPRTTFPLSLFFSFYFLRARLHSHTLASADVLVRPDGA